MALNVCAHCTTRFSIGAEHCPQCGNADYYEEGSMAKISRSGGPTYTGVQETSDGAFLDALVDEATGEEPEQVTPYEGMLRAELQDELASRDLPVSGNKPELIARLLEDDKENDMSEPEESTVEAAEDAAVEETTVEPEESAEEAAPEE